MEYHILTNINNKEPHQLQKPIKNKNGEKKIGIKSITYYVGYFVFENEEFYRFNDNKYYFPPGMYSIDDIREILIKHHIVLTVEDGTFLVQLSSYLSGFIFYISNNIMSQLGFKKDADITIGFKKSQIPLKIPRELHVCLEELKTSNNYRNGKPSTILEVLPANFIEEKINYLGYKNNRNNFETKKNYSSYNFKRFDYPSFKPLINGDINELKISFKNEKNEDITNDIFYTIEFCIK